MGLNINKLESGLLYWMENQSPITLESITLFADAYEDYAKDAVATSGGSLETYNKQAVIDGLASISPGGSAGSGALLFANALAAFWVGATLPPSVVDESIDPNILISALSAVFSNISETSANWYAEELAKAIDIGTRSVTTVNPTTTPPTEGVLI